MTDDLYDDDVRILVERGAMSWYGSSPRAAQARWAAQPLQPRRTRAGRLVGVLFAVPVLAGIMVALVTASHPEKTATQVLRVVSQGLAGPTAPPAAVPSPSPSASPLVVRRPAVTEPEPASRPRTGPPPTPRPDE